MNSYFYRLKRACRRFFVQGRLRMWICWRILRGQSVDVVEEILAGHGPVLVRYPLKVYGPDIVIGVSIFDSPGHGVELFGNARVYDSIVVRARGAGYCFDPTSREASAVNTHVSQEQ